MGLKFNYVLKVLHGNFHEYEVFLGDEIFCHLSQSDFWVFNAMCLKSGNKLLRRV